MKKRKEGLARNMMMLHLDENITIKSNVKVLCRGESEHDAGGEPYYYFLVNVEAVCLDENDHLFIPVGQLHQLVPLHCQSAIDNFLEKRTKLRI